MNNKNNEKYCIFVTNKKRVQKRKVDIIRKDNQWPRKMIAHWSQIQDCDRTGVVKVQPTSIKN